MLKHVQIIKLDEWKVGIIECDFKKPISSHLANTITYELNVDFAAIISGNQRNQILMRAHANPNVDLTKICEKYGNGGGHPKAASMILDVDYKLVFLQKK